MRQAEFDRVARLLAKRVVNRRIGYGYAQDILFLSRAGKDYCRLEKAEREAGDALGKWFAKHEQGLVRAWKRELAGASFG